MHRKLLRGPLLAVVVGLIVSHAAKQCAAGILYVDNRRGSDAFDGTSAEAVSDQSGPTRSIGRALKLAQRGDTIIVRNTGTAYYESIQLSGPRHSGYENFPFTLVGNGAVIDGSRRIPANAWRNAGGSTWQMTPWRKGHYQLLLNDKPVPEHRPKAGAKQRPAIPAGRWTAWKGSIYYQAMPLENPLDKPFRFAHLSVGLTLFNVRNVQVLDITFRNFRLDGVNAHDLCSRVMLEKVIVRGNGRSGVAVGGSAAVLVRNCVVEDNRFNSVLITELGGVKIEETKLNQPPTVRKP